MGVPSSRVSHQACSSELDPRDLSSNGILGNRGLIRVGPLGLKAHVPRKRTVVFKGCQIFQGIPRRPGVRQRFGRITVGHASRGMLFVLGLLVLVISSFNIFICSCRYVFSSCHWPLRWPSTNDDKRDGVGLLFRLPCMLFTEYSLGNRGCAHTEPV